jgi:hypothetical protein
VPKWTNCSCWPKIPQKIRKRVMERPDAFRKFADLDDGKLDEVLKALDAH